MMLGVGCWVLGVVIECWVLTLLLLFVALFARPADVELIFFRMAQNLHFHFSIHFKTKITQHHTQNSTPNIQHHIQHPTPRKVFFNTLHTALPAISTCFASLS
jgi:hypothetical protein